MTSLTLQYNKALCKFSDSSYVTNKKHSLVHELIIYITAPKFEYITFTEFSLQNDYTFLQPGCPFNPPRSFED
jgi:hypothetical protein